MSGTPKPGDRRMYLFTDDHQTFVAADMDDLRGAWVEHAGSAFDEDIEWRRMGDGEKLTIWCNAKGFPDEPHIKGNAKVTKTAAEWAAEQPRGMLCAEDY